LNNLFFTSLFLAVFAISCDKDDDDGPEIIPPRDRAEQEADDQVALLEYLETHTFNYEEFENPSESFDYVIRFDTIHEINADKIPLIDSEFLKERTLTRHDVEYKYYVLKIREGEREQPKFTDSTYVSYKGELLDRTRFDNSTNPVWFDLTRVVTGFAQALTEFKGSTGFVVNTDNTVTWNPDFGIGAVIMPSGLGYFSNPPSGSNITAYSPLVFGFKLMGVNEADHDGDGVPSWMEDVNQDGIIENDDTDGNGVPNFFDRDDDGDFIPTREEIIINEDGSIEFPDKDGDGVPDYLDSDY